MKKLVTILKISGVLLSSIALGLFIFGAINLYLNKPAGTCHNTGKNYSIEIQNDQFSIHQITGKLCDTLTITNMDTKVRVIAFGKHDNHQAYDGITEKLLQKNGSFTVTFVKTGTYEIHDHLEANVQAFFTATN